MKKICEFENCDRKLNLIDISIPCKCGGVFCMKHRYFLKHNCKYQYRNNI